MGIDAQPATHQVAARAVTEGKATAVMLGRGTCHRAGKYRRFVRRGLRQAGFGACDLTYDTLGTLAKSRRSTCDGGRLAQCRARACVSGRIERSTGWAGRGFYQVSSEPAGRTWRDALRGVLHGGAAVLRDMKRGRARRAHGRVSLLCHGGFCVRRDTGAVAAVAAV